MGNYAAIGLAFGKYPSPRASIWQIMLPLGTKYWELCHPGEKILNGYSARVSSLVP